MTSPSFGMSMGMQTKLQQQQILAPKMIQSMEILQLPIMELQERIQEELQANPVLEEVVEGRDEVANETDVTLADIDYDANDPREELVIDTKGNAEDDFERLLSINEDWSDHFNEEHRPSASRIEEYSDNKHLAETNMVSRPQSLQDYLADQLSYLDAEPIIENLARFIISHIDENGYLTSSLPDIVASYEVVVNVEDAEEALQLIQRLDPLGVGARDLRECLLLQLNSEIPFVDVLRVIIQNHLEDIQHNRLPNIQKRTGFELSVIQDAIMELRHLNPKPGAQFKSDNVQYVVPDILVERNEDGEFEVRLLDDWTPSVNISRKYIKMYRDKASDANAREFLKRKIQAAQWLIEAIEQRRNTLLKVSKAIINHQRAFLDHGLDYIEPLKMQQIADLVGVHVTTVSRAVDDKWIQTPRGVFPLKRFFGGGTQTASGEEVAYEAIKRKLLDLVEEEDKSNPLSDDHLVKMLNDAGYPVARRTVTKYRKLLDIPSSRQRKVWS